MPRSPSQRYELRVRFDAPLPFVYRWCTDYRADDPERENENYQRRILTRSKREVVFEDLATESGGWRWSRHTVSLTPPDRWHSDSIGNYREYSLDYTLRPLSGRRTELLLTARRRPALLGGPNPSAARFRLDAGRGWKQLRRSLERDYLRSRRRARK